MTKRADLSSYEETGRYSLIKNLWADVYLHEIDRIMHNSIMLFRE